MDRPHIGIDQEAYIKINEYNNVTPENETKGTEINQKDSSRCRPRGQVQNQCSFLYYRGPKYNMRRNIYYDLCGPLPITSNKGNK